ncbi:MAG: tRNA-dihydrouridine synthase [Patescibacteria group bacterium]
MKKNEADISVNLNNKIVLKNPFILGAFELTGDLTGLEMAHRSSAGKFGAIVIKTTTIKKRSGYSEPKVANFGDGYLVASGMKNPGIKAVCGNIRIFKKLHPEQVLFLSIAPINPKSVIKDLVYLARAAAKAGVDAVELNLSCPHSDQKEKFDTCIIAQNPALVRRIVSQLKAQLADFPRLALIPKLSGWNCDLTAVALAAEQGGADAVVISNIFPGTGFFTGINKINNNHHYQIGQHLVGNEKGGFTGKALHSAVLLMVEDVKRQIKIPIIATGGCATDSDSIIQTFFAGASAIETVTPFYFESDHYKSFDKKISGYLKDLSVYMKKNGLNDLDSFYHLAHRSFWQGFRIWRKK